MKVIASITLREMTEDERPDAELSMFPDAHETLDRLKELGIKLALITNGAAEPQRAKVVRR